MKCIGLLLAVLSLCASSLAAFEVITPESKRADAAWERKLRQDFDLRALRKFLVQTLAHQHRFDGRDLGTMPVDADWKIDFRHRTLRCGGWWFYREEKGNGFQFRHHPDGGEREIVFVCERLGRKRFRCVTVRWEPLMYMLASAEKSPERNALIPRNSLMSSRLHKSPCFKAAASTPVRGA